MTQAWDFVDQFDLWQTCRSILGTAIDEHYEWLSVRAINALSNEGIKTVGDLIACTIWDIRRIPNVGARTRKEIERFLAEHNLELKCDR